MNLIYMSLAIVVMLRIRETSYFLAVICRCILSIRLLVRRPHKMHTEKVTHAQVTSSSSSVSRSQGTAQYQEYRLGG